MDSELRQRATKLRDLYQKALSELDRIPENESLAAMTWAGIYDTQISTINYLLGEGNDIPLPAMLNHLGDVDLPTQNHPSD